MTTTFRNARLNLCLPSELAQAIEEAAALADQSVTEFAISAIAHSARTLIQEQSNTILSKRDQAVFNRLLDRTGAKPNKELVAAARRYKNVIRKPNLPPP